jgi:hypothetical protein
MDIGPVDDATVKMMAGMGVYYQVRTTPRWPRSWVNFSLF